MYRQTATNHLGNQAHELFNARSQSAWPNAELQRMKHMSIQVMITNEQERVGALGLERESALPWAQRTSWRKRQMYRGWMLEPIEERHEGVTGSSPFVITRSNYGYRVLNSPALGIIDVDFGFDCGISKLHVAVQQAEAIANLRDWVESHPEQSWRIYRTAAGMRMIRTDAPQPLDDSYDAVCNAIDGADDLYRRLCKEQNAFRARISAKPARCGAEYPDWWPYDDGGDGWEGHPPTEAVILAYEKAAQGFKVAELIEWVGTGEVCPELVAALDHHDKSCGVHSALPLEQPAESEYVLVSNVAELVAFNDVYRPNGWAPNDVWDRLSPEVQLSLRHLERYRDDAIADCKRLDRLFHKWCSANDCKDFHVLYQEAFEQYKEDAERYVWVPTPGEVASGSVIAGHWQSLEEIDFPHDPRYWQLGNPTATATTSAVIRLIPSPDKRRYVERSVGLQTHFVSNILVVNDPRNPHNNGKVFLFRYGFSVDRLIRDLMTPPPEFPQMSPIDPWDMTHGVTLKLRARLIDGTVSLDSSSFDHAPTPVGDEAAIAAILTQVYSLDEA
jgi:hypothetical protein